MTTQTTTTRQQSSEVLPFKKRYITPEQVSELYGVTLRQLKEWRLRHIGPPFRRFGRFVLYNVALLDQWAERQKDK